LAPDYLLASEGGVCGKFNLDSCCIQIDDTRKVIKEITDRMRKIAHVPVQIWKGWNSDDLLGGWFSTTGRIKTMCEGYINGVRLSYTPMLAATYHVVHINPDRSHNRMKKQPYNYIYYKVTKE
jgi:hypothetical protein